MDIVANSTYSLHVTRSVLFRAVWRRVSVTGWDSLASQAASIEGRGERTDTALVVSSGLISA